MRDEEADILVEAQTMPVPQVEAGKLLGTSAGVHAMMDLSDGLANDLAKMTQASGVGAAIDMRLIPTSPALAAWALQRKIDAKDFAVAGGEDYQLLCAIDPHAFAGVAAALSEKGVKLTAIGEVTEGSGVVYERDGSPVTIQAPLFSHFAEKKKGRRR